MNLTSYTIFLTLALSNQKLLSSEVVGEAVDSEEEQTLERRSGEISDGDCFSDKGPCRLTPRCCFIFDQNILLKKGYIRIGAQCVKGEGGVQICYFSKTNAFIWSLGLRRSEIQRIPNFENPFYDQKLSKLDQNFPLWPWVILDTPNCWIRVDQGWIKVVHIQDNVWEPFWDFHCPRPISWC